MKALFTLIIVSLLGTPSLTYAGGHGGGRSSSASRSYAPAPGTGSKPSSTRVRSYTQKDGSTVGTYRRTTSDTKFENNYSTKGNYSPYTGKPGNKVTPHAKN